MKLIINGVSHQAAGPMSLAQAVALLTPAETGVAAALNGDVVRRSAWDTTRLADGDQVEVVTAVQGG
jgi:sulfur carrier protein